MREAGAGKRAEMPERAGKVGDGIAEDSGHARRARTARDGQAGAEAPMLIDQVVSRENLIRALRGLGLISLMEEYRRLACSS